MNLYYKEMIYACAKQVFAAKRKSFIRKWRLKRRAVASSLEEEKCERRVRFAAGICGAGELVMDEDMDEPESEGDEEQPPKRKAEDNPWYLLATLYGQGERDKNRFAWNRYFAGNLDEETRARLIKRNRHDEEELTPFLPEQLEEIK